MPKRRIPAILGLAVAALAVVPSAGLAQLVIGQYEDEAPLRTWNTFPFTAAASLGRGETSFSLSPDCSAGVANPALLSLLPDFTLFIDGSITRASFQKYGLVNTGVLYSEANMIQGVVALDFAGLSFRIKGWTFAADISLPEYYNRPGAAYRYSDRGTLQYLLRFTQVGVLRDVHFSAARSIGRRISAGLGVHYIWGSLERETLEQSAVGYTITDRKTRDFRGVFANGGVLLELGKKLRLGLSFRAPFRKKAENRSFLEYAAPAGNTDIIIEGESQDSTEQPSVLGMGASWMVSPKVMISGEVAVHAWSRYSVSYFGEKQERDFRDTIKLGTGAEAEIPVRAFGMSVRLPLRIGLVCDQQPMRSVRSTYLYMTAGTGLHWTSWRLDVSAAIGRETGSGAGLTGTRFAASLGYGL